VTTTVITDPRPQLVVRRSARVSDYGNAETLSLAPLAAPRYAAHLWPRGDDVSSLFRLAMLPLRILSVATLWATSRPSRLLFTAVLAIVVAVFITR
jgi:hypothetical protein